MYQYIVMLYDIYMILVHIYIYICMYMYVYIRVHLHFIPLFLSTSHSFQPWNIISISQAENGTCTTLNRPDILGFISQVKRMGRRHVSPLLCFPDVSPPAVASPWAPPCPPPERKLNVAASAAACCGLGEKSGDGQKWGKDGVGWNWVFLHKIVRNFRIDLLDINLKSWHPVHRASSI